MSIKKHQQFKTLSVLESFFYSSIQMFLGLLLHPYRSMQLIVKTKILLPFILYPTLIGLLLCLILKFTPVIFIYNSSFIFSFSYQVALFFCFYWQLMLFYLLLRFARAFLKLYKS